MKNILISMAVVAILPPAALADDYKPAVCVRALDYAGAPKAVLAPDLMPGDYEAAGQLDAATSDRLDEALTKARAHTKASAIGATLVVPGKGAWSRDLTAPGAKTDNLFYWASAGKTFTAIAILQLVDEGKLSLNDPISKWVEGVPNGDVITLRHLLNHTSGLFSANEDKGFRKNPHRLTLEDELKIVRKHGAMFCPGENWRYSNSGYGLLGAVLERAEQKPYKRIIQDRIISPLNLKHMRVLTADDALSDVVHLVSQGPETALDPRGPGPAGGIAASPADMIAVWQALLGGKLLKPETVKLAFADLYPMFGTPQFYGLGVMMYRLPDGSGTWIGHSGGAPGVKAVVVYSTKTKAFVAVAISGDGSAEATANLLLRQMVP